MWSKFDTLAETKLQATKKVALLVGIKKALTRVFPQVSAQPDEKDEQLK